MRRYLVFMRLSGSLEPTTANVVTYRSCPVIFCVKITVQHYYMERSCCLRPRRSHVSVYISLKPFTVADAPDRQHVVNVANILQYRRVLHARPAVMFLLHAAPALDAVESPELSSRSVFLRALPTPRPRRTN